MTFLFLILIVMFIFILSLVLYMVNFLLSKKINKLNKMSVFESGFNSIFKIQIAFSIHFFIIVLLFVLFDLEVVMLLAFLMSSGESLILLFFLVFFIFLGLYLEWFLGKLIWLI